MNAAPSEGPGTTGARWSPWHDRRVRSAITQVAVAAAVLALGASIVGNVVENLSRLGINAGFGFLSRPAGFGIVQHLIPYSESSSYAAALLVAVLNTMALSAIGIAAATLLGFVIGLARLSGNLLLSHLAAGYVEILRNVPLLLQIFFWYFAVLRPLPGPRQSIVLGGVAFLNNRGLYMPAPVFGPGAEAIGVALVLGIAGAIALISWARRRQRATGRSARAGLPAAGLILALPLVAAAGAGFPMSWDVPALAGFNFQGGVVVIPEFVAMLAALSIYAAAFIAEIVRAGVLAVPQGQVEAARALGLTKGQITRFVVVPQALRVIVPPLTSQYLNLVKNSSLAAAIAYPDVMLVFAGTVLNQTGQAIEVMAITMGFYLALSLLIAAFMNWYNRAVAMVER
jgi:general L-amino acid transport system permease protein